jgi:hypothetical protein
MELEERKEFQEEETDKDDMGSTLIAIGAIFLVMDLVLLLFLGTDLRAGSKFYAIWEAVQTALAVVLIAIGIRHKMRAHTKEDA